MALSTVAERVEQVLPRSLKSGFIVGACVGVLGGLIGLAAPSSDSHC